MGFVGLDDLLAPKSAPKKNYAHVSRSLIARGVVSSNDTPIN
jgi:hypothetical protein